MLFSNARPRYLPHLQYPEVLNMGLSPLRDRPWIDSDGDLPRYRRHKLQQRDTLGDRVYRCTAQSLPAQRELHDSLLRHLVEEQAQDYRLEDGQLICESAGFSQPLLGEEPLWECSLWIADDLVIMEELEGEYLLTAASLCSPSHWRLEDKFNRPLRKIHDPIPGFHATLTPSIDRFFQHLRPDHPVVRFNWSLQAFDSLDQRPELDAEIEISPDTLLYYRVERQSLLRLPTTGAIAFSIRVYLHPLHFLAEIPDALPALLQAVDDTPPDLAAYKAYDELAPALEKYRN